MNISRGTIWWADLPYDQCNPHFQSGTRPVVIVSNNKCNQHSPAVLVCPITTREDKYKFIHPEVNCYKNKISYILCEHIRVLDKEHLHEFIKQLTPDEEDRMNKSILLQLGLLDCMQPTAAPLNEQEQQSLELGEHIKSIFTLLNINSVDVSQVNTRSEIGVNVQPPEGTNQITSSSSPKLGRPNARYWTDKRIIQYVADYPVMSISDLMHKYNLVNIKTAKRYYWKFTKHQSL